MHSSSKVFDNNIRCLHLPCKWKCCIWPPEFSMLYRLLHVFGRDRTHDRKNRRLALWPLSQTELPKSQWRNWLVRLQRGIIVERTPHIMRRRGWNNNERRVMVSAFSTECVPQVRFLIIISEVCTFHASESAAYGLLSSPCYTVYYTSGAGIEPMTLRTEDQHFDHSAKLNCLMVLISLQVSPSCQVMCS